MKHFESKNYYHSQYGLKSQLSAIILFIWYIVALIVPNCILAFTEKLAMVPAATNVVLPLGIYWLAMSLSRNPGKGVLWLFPFAFLSAFELVLLQLFGRSVIAVDMYLNLITTNPGEAGELLGNMVPILCIVVVLYLIPLILAIVSLRKHWQLTDKTLRRQRGHAITCMGIGAMLFIASFFANGDSGYKPGRDLFPVNAINNAIVATQRVNSLRHQSETSGDFRFNATTEFPDSVKVTCVVVVGETGRAANWQLGGYERPTNEPLTAVSNLVYFDKALSESNTTHKSVPMLLSHLTADTYNDSIDHVKSLITAFKEAGYTTYFFSAQRRNHSYIDFFGEEADNCEFIYDWLDIEAEKSASANGDMRLLQPLAEALADTATKKLIVLHTYGSHFNYGDRYGVNDRKFTPDSDLEANKKRRANLINAYDNTIVATSRLLAEIAAKLDSTGVASAMVYTSDHGEDIFDDSRNLFLHASPVPSGRQIHVPMIVWMSDEYVAARPEALANARQNQAKNVSSSEALFQTVSDLGRLRSSIVKPSESLLSKDYTEPRRRYLNDLNESVTLRGAKLDDVDFDYLDAKKISY